MEIKEVIIPKSDYLSMKRGDLYEYEGENYLVLENVGAEGGFLMQTPLYKIVRPVPETVNESK